MFQILSNLIAMIQCTYQMVVAEGGAILDVLCKRSIYSNRINSHLTPELPACNIVKRIL